MDKLTAAQLQDLEREFARDLDRMSLVEVADRATLNFQRILTVAKVLAQENEVLRSKAA